MSQDYDYWHNALAGTFGPVHDSDPQPGFYRKRLSRGGAFVPVAIWRATDGVIVCLVDGRSADANDVWTYVCQHPVTEAAYHQRANTGAWPDEDAAVTDSFGLPPVNHNNPPQDDADILKGQIEAASANMADYAEITDDEAAARAQSVRSRLLELSGTADKKRETEKKPHLEASRAVDAKWQPLVKMAKDAADVLRNAMSAHETRKARAAAEAARKVEEARIKAEREAVKAAAKGQTAVPAPPPPAPVATPVQTQVKGAYGRAAPIKAIKVARVTDQDALYPFLKTHPELVALMAKLAQRAVDAGHNPTGVEIEEERRVA